MNLYDLHKDPETLKHHEHRAEVIPESVRHKVADLLADGKPIPDRYINNLLQRPAQLWSVIKTATRYVSPEKIEKAIPEKFIDAVLKSPSQSFEYAQVIKRGRWKEGEKTIATSGWFSYKYATEILRKRFPAGEKTILRTPNITAHYMTYLDLEPEDWPEGYSVVQSSETAKHEYKQWQRHRNPKGHR